MKITIKQKIELEMQEAGYRLLGMTTGTFTFRKNSNLSKYLIRLGKTESQVVVKAGARAGRMWNDGHQLLVFERIEQ